MKTRTVAIILSVLIPGLGHFYIKKNKRAIIWFSLWLVALIIFSYVTLRNIFELVNEPLAFPTSSTFLWPTVFALFCGLVILLSVIDVARLAKEKDKKYKGIYRTQD